MSATVYTQERDGTLHPIGHSERSGTDAILDVLLREAGVRTERTTYVAYDDTDGAELEIRA